MSPLSYPPRASGFSLVEIMVGLVIGLLGVLVIMQVATISQEQQRTTTSGDNAQNNGAIALYGLQSDIRQAGYGVSTLNLIGCGVTLRAGVTLNAIAPVTINPSWIPAAASDANTDTVLVVYGNSNGAAEGVGITSGSGTIYPVATPTAFNLNDQVIAEPQTRPASCALIIDTVAGVNPPASPVTVTTGTTTILPNGNATDMTNGMLYNLGQQTATQWPVFHVYAIRNGKLTMCDYWVNDCGSAANAPINTANEAVWVPIASDIASLRAQYGRDTSGPPMDAIVDLFDQTTPTTNCGWVRISAVRLAVVARSGQYSKNNVTMAAPSWMGNTVVTGSTTGANNPTSLPIDLSSDSNWQHYRYKVFETVIPLRNVTWMGVQSGC